MRLASASLFQRGRLATRPPALSFSSAPRRLFAAASFQDLGVDARTVSGLKEMKITTPTGIQQKSIPAILARHDILCAAQTGTGKTLAYLVPVIEQILRKEAAKKLERETKGPTEVVLGRPSALVLLPSRELALQVASVAKQLSHSAKFASCTITSGERKSIQQKNTSRRLDLIIGTPGRVAKCISKGDFFVSCIDTVVVDEADTLFDAKMGFRKELDAVLGTIQASAAKRNQSLQMILAAATIRSPIDQILKKKFGELRVVSDDKIHKTPASIREEFVRVNPESKHSALREALHLHRRRAAKTMIFCRNSASVRSTEHMLREHGFQDAVCLHGDMPPARRHDAIHAFTEDSNVNILVCTDLAARGLDVEAVKHVVMFDFPKSAVDYVHRAGRTGRAGEQGLVTSLVTKHDLTLAMSIENSKRSNSTIKELREDTSTRKTARREPSQKRSGFGRGTKKLLRHKIRTPRPIR
ncbi:DEAD/DEAH box RNA helicase, putative [Phytophthora infestans T30-4]|uniref:DEAD/DEAH box RNA helicase, putative n=1 Tax=Phytophthora infestans (strain T30-4) TaxID=403677 RepID=D0NDW8_PHYIT|nr:DEAD/DEAH box RNA helicase, putative [Phytophthora infestans T30-4]EEY56413.1 DEAD/DEAH box RNA helicase, putative [Phytophthora infestans T30-4]|eukprot:XP_002902487.1 DEAD/DEAH box RNA helicase, putative [Phytophthora infestans T30-4]